jgi:hypothetical protein
MRTSFHHQPEAQHPNFPLSTSWQADYPIFRANIGEWPRLPQLVIRFFLVCTGRGIAFVGYVEGQNVAIEYLSLTQTIRPVCAAAGARSSWRVS